MFDQNKMTGIFFLITILFATFTIALANECTLPDFNLQGKDNGDHCAFLSIPFATAKRFQAPVDIHEMPRDMTLDTFHGFCPQTCLLPDGFCSEKITEDCLRLNIFISKNVTLPLSNGGPKLPVMAFLPGGGFEMGGAECLAYEGTEIVKRGVILVTINYRVGSFGFLVNKDMHIDGNMGIKDQLSALHWIQRNIQNFGGDAASVTLGGESAGAQSTAVHLVSSHSKGLIHKAILQSPVPTIWMRSMKSANKMGKMLADLLNCQSLECMQNVSIEDLLMAQEKAKDKITPDKLIHLSTLFLPFTPSIDDDILTDQPLKLIQQGKVSQSIPILMGSNEEEGRLFIFLGLKNPIGSWTYRGIVAALFKTNFFSVLDRYPVSSSTCEDFRVLTSTVATDYIFTAPIHNASLSFDPIHNTVYRYEYMQPLSFGWSDRYSYCVGHSCHGAELASVFAPTLAREKFTPEERKLSNLIIDYWTNFVKTGNPNGPSLPQWTPASINSSCMTFKAGKSTLQTSWRVDLLRFWNKIGYEKLE